MTRYEEGSYQGEVNEAKNPEGEVSVNKALVKGWQGLGNVVLYIQGESSLLPPLNI